MCGIAAFFSETRGISEELLESFDSRLFHRGPDDGGLWLSSDRKVALVHRRLSLVDVEGGNQPLLNENGEIVAVVNGEFYNYRTIRAELEKSGHNFRTDGDSEVLVHLYEEYGKGCLNFLRGEFAFIIYDRRSSSILAARDRFGIKPLFFTSSSDGTSFASEAELLTGSNRRWNKEALACSLRFQYPLDHMSLFEGVHSLRPGHFLQVSTSGLSEHCYWDISYSETTLQISYDEACLLFEEEFRDAVKVRLHGDVPICALMSGGIDSCSVAATASTLQGKPIDCFTVSFEGQHYDENELAGESCRYINSRQHVLDISSDNIIDSFTDAVIAGGGPAINGHISAKYLLTRFIKEQGFKVMLTGEGADEVLLGYPHFRQDLPATENTASLLDDNFVSRGLMVADEQAPAELEFLLHQVGSIPSFLAAKFSFGKRLLSLCAEGTKDSLRFELKEAFPDSTAAGVKISSFPPVFRSSYYWSHLALGSYILRTLGDRLEMRHSIEGRLPFLDHKLFELVSRFPVNYLINRGVEKAPLRSITGGLIPDSIRNRRKHPFIAPPVFCSSERGLAFISDFLSGSAFESAPFLDRDRIKRLVSRIPDMDETEKKLWDPVLTYILSMLILGQHHRLSL